MSENNRSHPFLYGAIGLVLVLLIVSIFCHFLSAAAVKKARALQIARSDPTLSSEDRREKSEQLREVMSSMTPDQRASVMAEGRKRFEERIINYTKLSNSEKTKLLDEQIGRMQQMRRDAPNAGSNPGSRSVPSRSAEDREKRRRERLDQTTPEFRAAMDQYRRDMAARRQQRGLPPLGGR